MTQEVVRISREVGLVDSEIALTCNNKYVSYEEEIKRKITFSGKL